MRRPQEQQQQHKEQQQKQQQLEATPAAADSSTPCVSAGGCDGAVRVVLTTPRGAPPITPHQQHQQQRAAKGCSAKPSSSSPPALWSLRGNSNGPARTTAAWAGWLVWDVITPNSQLALCWDLVLLVGIVYLALLLPFAVSFGIHYVRVGCAQEACAGSARS